MASIDSLVGALETVRCRIPRSVPGLSVSHTLLWIDGTTVKVTQGYDEPEVLRLLLFKCQGQLAHEGKLVAWQVFVQMDAAGRFSSALVGETEETAEVQLVAKRPFTSPGTLACSHIEEQRMNVLKYSYSSLNILKCFV